MRTPSHLWCLSLCHCFCRSWRCQASAPFSVLNQHTLSHSAKDSRDVFPSSISEQLAFTGVRRGKQSPVCGKMSAQEVFRVIEASSGRGGGGEGTVMEEGCGMLREAGGRGGGGAPVRGEGGVP